MLKEASGQIGKFAKLAGPARKTDQSITAERIGPVGKPDGEPPCGSSVTAKTDLRIGSVEKSVNREGSTMNSAFCTTPSECGKGS